MILPPGKNPGLWSIVGGGAFTESLDHINNATKTMADGDVRLYGYLTNTRKAKSHLK
jgi:hypothetical protein